MRHRVASSLLWVLVGCGGENSADEPSEATEFCAEVVYGKELSCDPLVEPANDFFELALGRCESMLEHAEANGCTSELQAVIDCADAAECEPYLQWVFQEPGGACVDEEQALFVACPDIGLRGAP